MVIDRRWFAPTVVGTLALGGLMFLGASRTWASAAVRADGLPTDEVAVTGADGLPIIAAMALVVAAGGLAVLSTRGRLRQVVGALIVAASLLVIVFVLTGSAQLESAFDDAVSQSAAFTGGEVPEPDGSVWRWIVGACALLTAGFGALTVASSAQWPTMSGRYDRPGATEEQAVDPDDASGSELWKALDDGRDPTA